MNKKELNEKIIDEIIKYAAAKHVDKVAEGLPLKEKLAAKHDFSQEFEKKMDRLFAQQKRKERSAKTLKNALRAAVIVLTILAALTVTIFSVDALRVPVLNFFIEADEKSTTIHITEEFNYDSLAAQIKGMYLPTYVTDAYQVSLINKVSDQQYHIEYKNPVGDLIIIDSLPEGSSAGIDNEGVLKEELIINGKTALYVSKKGDCTLLFQYNGLAFLLSAKLPKEEVLRMAESMNHMK